MNLNSSTQSFDWSLFLSKLDEKINDKLGFDSWIKVLSFAKLDGGILFLDAPSRFIKDWVLSSYKKQFLEVLKENWDQVIDIEIIVNSFANMTGNKNSFALEDRKDSHIVPQAFDSLTIEKPSEFVYDTALRTFKTIAKDNASVNEGTIKLDIALNPDYTFDNFVVGKPNEFAYHAALRVAKESNIDFNPLFIYGGVGLGKTHLMQSIAWEIHTSGKRKFLYLTAEKFANLFILSLRDKDVFSFKEIFRSTDVLMIDDFQFISGKEQTQEEFFHTFNSLISEGKQIILSADKPPQELDRIEERMSSRLKAGLAIDIHATTYELRVGILESKAKKIGIRIPGEVVDFLAHTIHSNVRELEGALKRIISYHSIMKVAIDLNMAMSVLDDVLKNRNKIVNIDFIQKKVAEHYNIKLVDMSSAKKDKSTAMARQIAMYIAKNMTSSSLPEIGRKFGGRDHTTVIYAIKKVNEMITRDSNLESELNYLIKLIQKS